MSAPAPLTVNVPVVVVNEALPARPVLPTSLLVHGGGTGPVELPPAVVNDHTGPVVVPTLLRATICQKYVVLPRRPEAVYDELVCPADTVDGVLVVPRRTS